MAHLASTVALLALVATSAIAQDYLPLAVGNRWEYGSGMRVSILTLDDGSEVFMHPMMEVVLSPATLEFLDEGPPPDYSRVVSTREELAVRPDPSLTLQVLSDTTIAGHTYYRFNTGSHLRYASDGRLLEYDGSGDRVCLDIPTALQSPEEFYPWGGSPLIWLFVEHGGGGFPACGVSDRAYETGVGTFTRTLYAGYHSGGTSTYVHLAEGVGIVYARRYNDTDSDVKVLQRAVVNDTPIRPTAVHRAAWGDVKRASQVTGNGVPEPTGCPR